MPVLRAAATAPYATGILSPLFDRFDILLDLFIVTGICGKDKRAGKALSLLGH
jgi:hypothetical protein